MDRISRKRDLRTSTDERDIGPKGPLIADVYDLIHTVPGAFNVDDTSHFHLILSMQTHLGLEGDLLEIGSYHGRSSAVMARYLHPSERLHICDAFQIETDDRYENKPTVADLMANIRRVNRNLQEQNIVIHECLSNELELEPKQAFRFIHIDGGHSEEQTLFDLNLVKGHLCNKGIVAVDDYHHPEWPGVTPAIDRFLAENDDYRVIADLNRHGAKGRKIYITKTDRIRKDDR
ncbi:MAG: class I SAM-dependent methyltransferase [Thermoplasmata archaeon]|nr:class I SAM-dependent methyltransferase [Thermoplasmata archaeon]